jgi:hypothetical protein
MSMFPVSPEGAQTLSDMLRTGIVPMPSVPSILIRAPKDIGELGQHWPFIRGGLAKIKRRQGTRSTWHPEHIWAAVTAGRAELWLALVSGQPVAYMVTQATTDPFLCINTSLFVWFAYSDPQAPREVVTKFDEFLCDMARSRGYAYVECLTARDGLARRMGRLGWTKVMDVLRKDLWEE